MPGSLPALLVASGVVLLSSAAATAMPIPPPTFSTVNRDPRFVEVYDDNIENLETIHEGKCPGDWKDLVYYMKVQTLSPDLFVVQQLSDRAQLTRLVRFMNTNLTGR